VLPLISVKGIKCIVLPLSSIEAGPAFGVCELTLKHSRIKQPKVNRYFFISVNLMKTKSLSNNLTLDKKRMRLREKGPGTFASRPFIFLL